MTDKQKLRVIDSIVAQVYETDFEKIENRGSFFEGLVASIFAVLVMEGDAVK